MSTITETITETVKTSSLVANEVQPHNVETILNYYKQSSDGSPPAPFIIGQPETYDRPFVEQKTIIHDISGKEHEYTLDSHGFQIYNHTSEEKTFLEDEKIKANYYPETEQLLKTATGAVKVFIFDHTIRRQPADERTPKADLRGPVRRVHIDQSYAASEQRVHYHLPEEADKLLQKRFQIINVWRPIRTVLKDPLGVADSKSVPDSDLVGAAFALPRSILIYAQTPEEVTLIKCFDSLNDGRARRVPHSAFTDEAEEDKYPRESIEVRALVFYDY